MTSFAVLAPGQGLELASVAAAWYRASVATRCLLDLAADQLQQPVSRLLHSSGFALRHTDVYQPVLTALCVGILQEVERRVGEADVALGHSLGELTACVAAGVLSDQAAVLVATQRGRLMAREAEHHPGGMLALRATVQETLAVIAETSAIGPISIAAFNAQDQHVVSGPHAALLAVPGRYAPMVIATGGAWHGPAMQDAVNEFHAVLRGAQAAPCRGRWIANRTGDLVGMGVDPVPLLSDQLTHPVQWVRSLTSLAATDVRVVVTLGPTKAQRTLARRTLGETLRLIPVELPDDLSGLVEALAA